MHGSTEDLKKKKAANKMKKTGGGQKRGAPVGLFLKKCVVFYETNVKKGFTIAKRVSFRWTA